MSERSSVVPPLFIDSAKELLARLKEVAGPAGEMGREVEEILKLFEEWERRPATATERADTVRHLLDLHRRVQEFLVKNRRR